MKYSVIGFLLLAFLAFISCEKGDLSKDKWDKEDKGEWDKGEEDKKACFELVYPVTYGLPDGSTASGGKTEVWETIKAWYEANPDSKAKPELQYPVEIIFEGEEVKTIHNKEEMLWAKKACADKEYGDKICFEILYPVAWLMPDGSEVTAENEDEFWNGVKSWYDANPGSEEKPELQYPVDVKYEDGSIGTIGSEEAMIAAKEDCFAEADDTE